MTAADSYFSNEAEASIRQGSDWDYQAERASLQVRHSPLIPPKTDRTSQDPQKLAVVSGGSLACFDSPWGSGVVGDSPVIFSFPDASAWMCVQQTMNFIAQKNKKLNDARLQAAQTQQQAMTLVQQTQQQVSPTTPLFLMCRRLQ